MGQVKLTILKKLQEKLQERAIIVDGGKKRKSQSGGKNKVRKHKGIYQRGGKRGKLKRGYKYIGQKLKNGLPKIKFFK